MIKEARKLFHYKPLQFPYGNSSVSHGATWRKNFPVEFGNSFICSWDANKSCLDFSLPRGSYEYSEWVGGSENVGSCSSVLFKTKESWVMLLPIFLNWFFKSWFFIFIKHALRSSALSSTRGSTEAGGQWWNQIWFPISKVRVSYWIRIEFCILEAESVKCIPPTLWKSPGLLLPWHRSSRPFNFHQSSLLTASASKSRCFSELPPKKQRKRLLSRSRYKISLHCKEVDGFTIRNTKTKRLSVSPR